MNSKLLPNVTNVTPKKRKQAYKRPSNEDLIILFQKCGGILSAVASQVGVARMTVKRWVDEDPELQAARIQARESFVDLAESVLMSILSDLNAPLVLRMTTAIYVTKTLGKDRGWVEGSVKEGKRVIRVIVDGEEDPPV